MVTEAGRRSAGMEKISVKMRQRAFIVRPEFVWGGALLTLAAGAFAPLGGGVPATLTDFFAPGTQPNLENFVPIFGPSECVTCHGNYDADHAPYDGWVASPMGQSARDPAFWACLAIANQDVDFAGDFCMRCHVPGGWLSGRSSPPHGSALQGADFSGVNCHMCHRMVDPMNHPGAPPRDTEILAALDDVPQDIHSAQYVVDNRDVRRGPYDLGSNFFAHDFAQAAFQSTSAMCATCHDVSNPLYEAQPDGTYTLNDLDEPHPTHRKEDQFPIERTYSEWLGSAFADGPIDMGARFGGSNPLVSSCQDCHMPEDPGLGCSFGEHRDELSTHQFNGGNTWLLDAVRLLYPDSETGLTDANVAASVSRTEQMLRAASDVELEQIGSELNVRIVNMSGHKLPTGYPEGRRMWINVRFLDGDGELLAERGRYEFDTADLTTADTKVYEAKLGVSEAVAKLAGVPAGEGFHFALNNVWIKDNRIPPMGFDNAEFEALQAAPVGYAYEDGQYWDDTRYEVPTGAVSAEVRLYYQSLSKEYVEFLRDENVTNDAGDEFYAVWLATGMSEPVQMDLETIALGSTPCNPADLAAPFGVLDGADVNAFISAFGMAADGADLNGDGIVDGADVNAFISAFGAGCP